MYCRVAGGRRADDDAVGHRPAVLQRLDHLRHRGALLADGHIDADDPGVLLVEDGVDGDGGLAGLTVADDQLALPSADRDHRVDRLDAGLQRLLHRLAVDDTRCDALQRTGPCGRDRTLAVQRLAQRADHPPDQRLADRHLDDAPGPLDGVPLHDLEELAEQHGADRFLLEVQRHAVDVVRQLQELARHAVLQAVDAGDAVPGGDDRPFFRDVHARLEPFDLLLQDAGDFVSLQFRHAAVSSGCSRKRF